MKTPRTLLRTALIGISVIGLTACAMTPHLDSQFGNSLNVLKAQQTIDPNASSSSSQVSIDGQAGREAVNRYYKSYQTPTPQPSVFTIGIGGS
ncbi:hypothetical protein [Glaciimonas sp. PCH181]|uniref:hypothetical protein n=1 Tax=Glaciimonas sp. PCH181 TaxID=2133943 RepID=UPI000D363EC4|nr:hypothetical protein [Glaciimonas sp. PCH181]PUA17736.1 hypothetical protein C7W93_17890 [Glaciimonas sp. PCH181]